MVLAGLASNILESLEGKSLFVFFLGGSEKSAGPVSFRGYWPGVASNFFCLSLTMDSCLFPPSPLLLFCCLQLMMQRDLDTDKRPFFVSH